jgi:hypothetical protein
MAYTINLTNGTILTTIADGTVNSTSCSLTLVGKNYAGYGTFLNTDLVHILENSASSTAPVTPLTGQLWWDSAGNLKVYTGSTFRTLGTMTASNAAPTSSVTGNAWWDTFNQQLNIYNGSGWVLIGPAFTSNTGQSGTIVGTIQDNTTASHVAVNVYVSNTLVGIISKDTEYTPQTVISGFSTIKPGFNLSTAVASNKFVGTATNADALGSVAAANYARTDTSEIFNSNVSVNNNTGLTVGTSNNFRIGVSGTTTQLVNQVTTANLEIIANVSGTSFTSLRLNGQTGQIFITNLATTGAFTSAGTLYAESGEQSTTFGTGAIRVVGGIGLTGNLSTNGNVNVLSGNVYANNFVGVASSALYADLAERFAADQYYEPGTVVKLGGDKEITIENTELSTEIFGVISSSPAYLMNASAGSDTTHPPVALNGRVPVKVIGRASKGQRLVSAGSGMARAANPGEDLSNRVLGRCLENKEFDAVDLVQAIVLCKV